MKLLFKKIVLFFIYLWNIKTNLSFRRINKKLYKTLEDREVDRIILKGQIVKMVREYIQINTQSKYIPSWHKSNAEIKEIILIKFGDKMQKLDIKINNNLKLSA